MIKQSFKMARQTNELEERIRNRLKEKGYDYSLIKEAVFYDDDKPQIEIINSYFPFNPRAKKEIKAEIRAYAKKKNADFVITCEDKNGGYISPFKNAKAAYVNKFPKDLWGFYIHFITKEDKKSIKALLKKLD